MLIDPEELGRYFSGKSNPQEKENVEAWLKAGKPESLPEWPSTLSKQEEEERLWSAISSRQQKKIIRFQKKQHSILWAAASLILFVLCLGLYYKSNLMRSEPQVSSLREVTAKAGQKIRFALPDGSEVVLNSGSTIRYHLAFDDTIRKVLLKGEAYFSVVKNAKKPFIVETTHTSVRVLGTKFNVSDYPDESHSTVTVESGRVAVWNKSKTDSTLLVANQQAWAINGTLTKNVIASTSFPSWRSGILQLQEITLTEAIPKIARWYGVKISLENKNIGNSTLKANFKDRSLQQLMEDLSFLLPIHYRMEGKKVIIY